MKRTLTGHLIMIVQDSKNFKIYHAKQLFKYTVMYNYTSM